MSGVELKLSEIFESIQGEGPTAGEPCVFLRLAMCNLHCRWCDTKYTWDWKNYDYDREVRLDTVTRVAERLLAARRSRLVITGGEPLMQQDGLAELLTLLPESWSVEVETNGTLPPQPRLSARVNQWNVSPKLANGGDPAAARFRPAALIALRDTRRAFLKLVVESEADVEAALALAKDLDWPHERVLLMPQAASRADLLKRGTFVAEQAVRRGVRYTSRLHVQLWGGRRGV